MIFAASSGTYLKKAKVPDVIQEEIKKIKPKLADDPRISGMNVLVITDQDITTLSGKKLIQDIKRRHPAINVIYLYRSDSYANVFSVDDTLKKQKIAKFSAETVSRSVLKMMESLNIEPSEMGSFDNDDVEEDTIPNVPEKKKGFGFLGFGKKKDPSTPVENVFNKRKEMANRQKQIEEDNIDMDDIPDELKALSLSEREREGLQQFNMEIDADEAILSGKLEDVLDNQDEPEIVSIIDPNESEQLDDIPMPKPKEAKVKEKDISRPGLEEILNNTPITESFDVLNRALKSDSLNRELMQQDSEYAGAKYILEQWDREILEISRDNTKSSEQKWNEIRELSYKRAERKGTVNNKLMDKMSVLLNTVTEVCKRTVEDRVSTIKQGLGEIIDSDVVSMNDQEIDKLRKQRHAIINELRELLITIVEIYKLMDVNVNELILTQDTDLPTSNDFINNQLSLEKELFKPSNMARLTSRILGDLHSHLISLSQMEKTLKDLIMNLFKIIDIDSAIIQEQEERYRRLKSVRVEETVTITSILKNSLRVFVGADDSGVTSTALTWCGLRSRRHNTLLVDIRKNKNKLLSYGVTPKDLKDFLASKEREHFTVLQGDIEDIVDLEDLLMKLEMRTDYYSSINMIMDDTQYELVNRAVEKAISINIITNSAISNVEKTKMFISHFSPENVGVKLIVIDPAVERLEFLRTLNADEFIYQIINVPYIKDMRSCAIRCERPYERGNISDIFEEAFR